MHIHAGQQNFGNGALTHKVRGARLETLGHAIAIFAVRKEDDRKIVEGMALTDAQADIEAVHLRHVDVEQHTIRLVFAQVIQSVFSGIAAFNAIADTLQEILGLVQDFFIVVNNKNFFFNHHKPPLLKGFGFKITLF